MTVRETQKRVLPTPFHARTSAVCETNLWSSWKAYTVVDCYTTLEDEYFAIRNATSVFDLSPMTKYRITGKDGSAYLDKLMTRRMDKLAPGRVMYALWCNDRGHVLDDGTVFQLGEHHWRLCSQERHLDWLLATATGFAVEISDESDEIAALAVQGPTSCRTLKAMGLAGIDNLKPFESGRFPFEDTELLVSRTGFTGDLGYELWIEQASAERLWDALFTAGKPYGILPIGNQALDMARIEAGFIQAEWSSFPQLTWCARTGVGLRLNWDSADWCILTSRYSTAEKPCWKNGKKGRVIAWSGWMLKETNLPVNRSSTTVSRKSPGTSRPRSGLQAPR